MIATFRRLVVLAGWLTVSIVSGAYGQTAGRIAKFNASGGVVNSVVTEDTGGDIGIGTTTPDYKLDVEHGGGTGVRVKSTSSFSVVDIDAFSGDAALRFARNGVNQWNIRNDPSTDNLQIFELGGGGSRMVIQNSTGNVGIGADSPAGRLHVSGTGTQLSIFQSTDNGAVQFRLQTDSTNRRFVALNNAGVQQSQIVFNDNGAFDFFGSTVGDKRLSIPSTGVLSCTAGIKTDANGLLSCITSSRHTKNVEGDLPPMVALANVMALRPQVGSYKTTPDEPEHWLIAEEVAAVDPALVGTKDGKPYTVKTQNIIADLVAVIQEQQRRIEALEQTIPR